MSGKPKVVIADDQYVARGFFEMYVKMSADYEFAASLATAEQAVNYCRRNPAEDLYKPYYGAQCSHCGMKLICNGCSQCGKCG